MMLTTPPARSIKPISERVVTNVQHNLAGRAPSTSTQALVRYFTGLPRTTPVLMRVSQATRPRGSSFRIASSTASEIWSAHLVRMTFRDRLGGK